MRPLILKMDISLDGFVGTADGDVQWAVDDFGDPALQQWMLAGLWDAGTHLMGRGAYDDMAPHWPTSTDIYAGPMNEIPKVVFSHTLTDPEWADTRVVSGDLATEIEKLKAEDGKPLLLFGDRSRLRLTGSRTFSTGVVASTFVPEPNRLRERLPPGPPGR